MSSVVAAVAGFVAGVVVSVVVPKVYTWVKNAFTKVKSVEQAVVTDVKKL